MSQHNKNHRSHLSYTHLSALMCIHLSDMTIETCDPKPAVDLRKKTANWRSTRDWEVHLHHLQCREMKETLRTTERKIELTKTMLCMGSVPKTISSRLPAHLTEKVKFTPGCLILRD